MSAIAVSPSTKSSSQIGVSTDSVSDSVVPPSGVDVDSEGVPVGPHAAKPKPRISKGNRIFLFIMNFSSSLLLSKRNYIMDIDIFEYLKLKIFIKFTFKEGNVFF